MFPQQIFRVCANRETFRRTYFRNNFFSFGGYLTLAMMQRARAVVRICLCDVCSFDPSSCPVKGYRLCLVYKPQIPDVLPIVGYTGMLRRKGCKICCFGI